MIAQAPKPTLAQLILPKSTPAKYYLLAITLAAATALFVVLLPESFTPVTAPALPGLFRELAENFAITLGAAAALALLPALALRLLRDGAPTPAPAIIRDAMLIVGFSFFITLFARVSFHLGENPVPVTGQTLAVLLTGAALGSRLGILTTLAYLIQGSAGMHVFADGTFGAVWTLGSGGYIIGFVVAAGIIGYLAERGWDRDHRLLVAMLIGNVALYVPGLIQLAVFYGWDKAIPWGLTPFILGDAAKLYAASLMVPAAWALAQRSRLEAPAWR